MIYLDASATTPLHPEVLEAMMPYLTERFHNPSSPTMAGHRVRKAINRAREQVAALIGAEADEILFTACGTESNNLALRSMAADRPAAGTRLVTSAIEHSAVLKPCEALGGRGFELRICGVDREGRLRTDEFAGLLATGGPGFASLMWANNETGVIQPVEEACALAKERGWAFHTDAIQAIGKRPIEVGSVPVDYLSISAHKIHAPKGVGALYVRRGARLDPLLLGGGQESGRRSGTENAAGIVGLGKAAEIMRDGLERDGHAEWRRLRHRFEERLRDELDGVSIHGAPEHRLLNLVHVSFAGCDAASLLILLDEAGVQCSAGSACMTGSREPSHVLQAMDLPEEELWSSLRFSLPLTTTAPEIEGAVEAVKTAVGRVRGMERH